VAHFLSSYLINGQQSDGHLDWLLACGGDDGIGDRCAQTVAGCGMDTSPEAASAVPQPSPATGLAIGALRNEGLQTEVMFMQLL